LRSAAGASAPYSALDEGIRVSSLGPTGLVEFSALVDRAVPLVFTTAQPNNAAGAAASNAARRNKGISARRLRENEVVLPLRLLELWAPYKAR
jgi:hypothetical protein